MSTFERYLTVWVFLCIAVGVALGHLMPGVFQIIGSAEIAKVNIPTAMPLVYELDDDFKPIKKGGEYLDPEAAAAGAAAVAAQGQK